MGSAVHMHMYVDILYYDHLVTVHLRKETSVFSSWDDDKILSGHMSDKQFCVVVAIPLGME